MNTYRVGMMRAAKVIVLGVSGVLFLPRLLFAVPATSGPLQLNLCLASGGKITARPTCKSGERVATLSLLEARLNASSDATGTVTGVVKEFRSNCKAVNPRTVRARREVPKFDPFSTSLFVFAPGTSVAARGDSSGRYTISSVPAGRYTLAVSRTADGLPTDTVSVVVSAGGKVQAPTLYLNETCCGNGAIDKGEECDSSFIGLIDGDYSWSVEYKGKEGFTCKDLGISDSSGYPECVDNCQSFDADTCDS